MMIFIKSLKTCNSSWRSIQNFGILIFILSLIIGCSGSKKENIQAKNPNGRNDSWNIIGFGGGGAMFHATVSPHDENYVYINCDMRESFVTYNGGESWRVFCLRSLVNFYTFDPLDTNIIYANSTSIGLFRSADKGNTWNIIYPDPSEIVMSLLRDDEAFESVLTTDSTKRDVLAFAVDPANSKILYAAISINKETGFYISSDAGAHWIKDKELEDSAKNIFIVPSSPPEDRVIYITGKNTITTKENGFWKINKGPTGVKMLTEFTGGFDQKKNRFIIYATSGKSYFNPGGDPSGIYYTDDGGKTWENRQNGMRKFLAKNADLPEWRSIATSLLHPEVIYVSYNGLKVHNDTTCIGVAKSEDFGKTWKLALKDCLMKGGYKYSGNYKGGWLDERYDPTWGDSPFSLGVSPTNPAVCYITDFGRTIKTTNGGKNWEQLYTRKKEGAGWISRGLNVSCGYSIVFDPFDLNHMFITNTDIGLMESKDGGVSWNSATKNNGIPNAWFNTYRVVFDPDVKGKAWGAMSGIHDLPRYKMWKGNNELAGYNGGIVVTEDSGKSWQVVSQDIGEATMTCVLIDSTSQKESRTLYACAFGKGVYKSIDGGKTWKQKNNGIMDKMPLAWSIERRKQDGALFLIVNRKNENGDIGTDQDGALYKSTDGAENWVKLTLPPETNCPTSILFDPENTKYLVMSAWGRNSKNEFSPCIGGGIFISKDDGLTWQQVFEKDQFIHNLTYDSRNKRYYACGFSSSAYWSDDKAKTWKRIKGYNYKLGRRVDIDPLNPEMIYITTYGSGVWHGPAKGDENATEDIITPILAY
jgi:photosystem II stability/assembly factor-like uncharacterized protein